MRDIRTKELGATILALATLQWACESGGPAGPSSLPSTAPTLSSQHFPSLAGTWRGGDTTIGLVWQLTQDGTRIKGSSRIYGSEWTTEEGSVVGTVAGTTFEFTESHAAGTVSAGCTAELQGTLLLKSVPDRPSIPPGKYWQDPPDPPQRDALTGRISGRACDGPVDMTVALFRD